MLVVRLRTVRSDGLWHLYHQAEGSPKPRNRDVVTDCLRRKIGMVKDDGTTRRSHGGGSSGATFSNATIRYFESLTTFLEEVTL
jgi:hypothetical protein